MAYNQQQQQQGYRPQQQQQQHHQQYIPPHARPRVASSSSSQGMDLDQPPRSPGAAASQGEYVYFDRHPELYDSLKGKANECKLRLELWYKDGVEGAVQRRERSVVSFNRVSRWRTLGGTLEHRVARRPFLLPEGKEENRRVETGRGRQGRALEGPAA